MIVMRFFQNLLPTLAPSQSSCRCIALAVCLALPPSTHAQWQLDDKPAKPAPAKPAPAKPAPAKPTLAKPTLAKPTLAKPTSAKPAQTPPASANPTESKSNPNSDLTSANPSAQNIQTANNPMAKPTQMRAIEQDHLRFIHVPRATLRCGPGADYYPTATLSKGSTVEVYVETDDGWSGIRPPAGSHNWVQADALYLMPGGRLAEVAQDATPAWVGSDAVKNEKLLFQTELSKTQSVAILGEAYRGQGDEMKLWFRIAPPQGEFRWIKSSMIGKTPIPKDPAYQEPAYQEPSPEKSNQPVIQASYQEPAESKLAWSDEAENTQRARQEIQREQQKIDQELKASRLETKAKSSILEKSPTQRQTRSKTRPQSQPQTQTQPQPFPLPTTQPRQRIQQRQVGPEQTDSMNHVLGIFGLSLVDPNNIQGHPLQGRPLQGRTRSATNQPAPYTNAAPFPNAGPLSYAANNPNPGALAGIDHLPRPSGRYAPSRYPEMNYNPQDTLAMDSAGSYPEDRLNVSAASFAPNNASPNPDAMQNESESFQTPQIQDALVQLSVIVSRPAEQWNLAPLRDSAQMWIERGETPLVRGEARLLLDRIERFESVRQRSSASPIAPPTNFSDAVPLRSPASESEMSGWLVAVHTSLPGQPEFAITDDLGNVKAYVRPTTGLNLRRYVQQPVTVFGPQGFLPNLNAKQVVADRVVRLR
jgi:SH3-like domain-containing protein